MTNIDALVASNQWWEERKDKGAHHYVVRCIPLLFHTLDALYIETRKLPLRSQSGKTSQTVTTSYTTLYGIFLNPTDHAVLRSILSLSGDVYEVLKPMNSLSGTDLSELESPVKKLYADALIFRQLRNFFTHLREAITDMDRHGISGSMLTAAGITYASSAEHCIHLMWENNTIYFTYDKKEWKVKIDKTVYDPIFQIAREIYRKITNHHNGKFLKQYIPVENLYPEVP